jgi:subtilase-type serine protease
MRVTKISSMFAVVAAALSAQSAHAQTQTIATPLNANVINLLDPFSTLLGTTAITQNFSNAVSINNNSTAAQRAQALIDNTITTDNGVVLSDGLGTNLNAIWKANNSQAANGTTTTFSVNVQTLFRQINAISQDDSGKAKNYFADGSANGSVFVNNANLALGKTATSNTPIVGLPLPAGGVFNVYDKAYAPITNPNLTGNSRPVQVSPSSIAAFSGVNYFGAATSNTAIIGGVTGNSGSGLFANASFPSGHTTFGYTTSILLGMLVPERYGEMLTRASEYGDSRIVLGAHYPLDIIGGRVIGTYDVVQMLNNNPQYTNATVNGVFGIGNVTTTGNFQTVFTAAQTDVRNLLTAGCGTDIATCAAAGAPDRFSNLAQDRAAYTARLTYGLPTLSFAQAPREAAPAGGPDASILLATVYGGDTAAAKTLAPAGGMFGNLSTNTINQILVNTETNAIAPFYGTALSYWARLDLFSAYTYFQGITGKITLASGDVVSIPVTVANSGTLAGTGTVGATTVAGGGALQPGAGGQGVLKINGSLAFQSGALYLVQVTSSGNGSANVTGTAALTGAGVQVSSPTSSFKFNQPVTILTSAGLGGTTFTSLTMPTGITGSLGYSANAVTLSMSSSLGQISGLNANQKAVANVLDGAFNTPGATTGALGAIFSGNVAQNLTQAAGETATGSQQSTFNAMTQFMGVMTDPMIDGRGAPVSPAGGVSQFAEEESSSLAYAANGKPRSKSERDAYAAIYRKAPVREVYDPRWTVWAAGFGGSQTTDGNTALGSNSTTSRIFGAAVGADYWFSPNTVAGFALAGGGTNFSIVNALGSGRSDLFQAGAFVRHTQGPAYITAALAYGWQDVTTNRTITIAGIDQLRAEFNANAYSGRVEGGYRFATPWIDGMGLTPYAAGQFTIFDLPAYAEQVVSGANTFAQAYAAKSVTATRSELGLRSDKSFLLEDSILTLRGRAAWAHDYNNSRAITATFQTLPGASFVVNGAAQAPNSALVTGSAEMKWRNGFSLAATFEGEFSDVTRSYAGKGVARYSW